MKKKLSCILLIDDNPDDNRFHQIIIKKMGITDSIQIVQNGLEAIEFLKKDSEVIPELIFLDINMPKMNGWEFLGAYKDLNIKQKAKALIVMLTTSTNPDDEKKAKEIQEVMDFQPKPLSVESLATILEKYFPDNK